MPRACRFLFLMPPLHCSVPAEPTFADLDIEDGMEEDRGAGGDDYAGSSDDEVHSGGEVSDDEDMVSDNIILSVFRNQADSFCFLF